MFNLGKEKIFLELRLSTVDILASIAVRCKMQHAVSSVYITSLLATSNFFQSRYSTSSREDFRQGKPASCAVNSTLGWIATKRSELRNKK